MTQRRRLNRIRLLSIILIIGVLFTLTANAVGVVFASEQLEEVAAGTKPVYALIATARITTTYITANGENFCITVSYEQDAQIPEGAQLEVKEIPEESEAFQQYLAQASQAMEVSEEEEVAFARFFDITIVSGGEEIQPLGPVEVKIELEDAQQPEELAQASVVHFGEETEVLESTVDETIDGAAITFETEGFSVFGIVRTTIEKNVLASDGHNYKISVTYGPEAGIPEGADLEVNEVTEGASVHGMRYEEYVAYTENALGMEEGSAVYIRLFDIKIVDKDDHSVKYQPKEGTTVDVHIELADKDSSDEAAENTQMVHFSDGSEIGEVVESISVEGNAISFKAEGFSAYAIVEGPKAITSNQKQITGLDDIIEDQPYIFSISRGGVNYMTAAPASNGTEFVGSTSNTEAEKWYFEATEKESNYYIYRYNESNNKEYIYVTNDKDKMTLSNTNKTSFTIEINKNTNVRGSFYIYHNSTSDSEIKPYALSVRGIRNFFLENRPNGNNTNECVIITRIDKLPDDPYELDNKSYGLMNWSGGFTGKAMMASSSTENVLDALPLTVMAKIENNKDKLFVPDDSDISLWTFKWISDDLYYLTSTSANGTKLYLKMESSGLSLVSDPDDDCKIQVVPGTGTHAGEICLKSGNTTLTYSGTVENGFITNGSAGSEWLNLVDISELTSEYFMTYSANKVSVSDASVTNGSRIIIYTRSWNDEKKRYEFYAIDHDGSLVPCYENGDSIQWLGSRLNTMLWNFVEYYWEGTNEPNYYYELYNQYSGKYIAPQITGGQILSGDTIGIIMNGRRNGRYYSPIVAWDDESYTYAGLKVENGKVAACPIDEADDFYFAILQDIPVDDTLTTVPTIDHTQYGITMKIVDFGTKVGGYNEADRFLGSNTGGAVKTTVAGLLSTALGSDGYPTNSKGESMSSLFSSATEVNHLFIASTYSGSGYYEFDSTQNFASLDTSTGNFKVYKEIGTMDGDNKNSLKHGQFMPFNDLEAGVFASVNQKNLYSATLSELPNSDPRKYEQMYLVRQPDYYFGMEIEAAFTQTPNGLDDWGHDIIYEFTGDDDFWLYVDGELIIDLGGIHSALPGSVNYSTGDVYVNGVHTTLKDLFYENYIGRGYSVDEANAYIDEVFTQNSNGQYIFKDYSTHTMKIFYMERGAGASNLHMRFNLASVRPGTVQLSKALSGVDATESVLAEFPYQIIYTKEGNAEDHYLTNQSPDSTSETENYVYYKGTNTPVKYKSEVNIGGVKYENVFLLKPGEIAEISFPEGVEQYRIVECGVNTQVYDEVTVNGQLIGGTEASTDRKDYSTGNATIEERATVTYNNHVNPDALRTLSITKQLFEEDGTTPIKAGQDSATFSFRLYLATEFDSNLDDAAASMYVYHVKDPHGNYCVWDASQQNFVALEEGKNDYANLTDDEKKAVSQRTSTYGQISKIPAGYTVEVRNLLAGTQFKVVERPTEIPDGYSFQKYIYNDTNYCDADVDADADAKAWAGVSDIVVANVDPHVDICNLKGWGLRVNKIWSDADYMSKRDATYFAVYTRDNKDNLTLVNQPNTVRQLAYGETTLYWYFLPLPVADVPFDHYEIREVELENPTVDGDGNVTNYGSIKVLNDGAKLILNGRQTDESTDAKFEYKVLYERGKLEADSNVRVDTVTNDRPGIILKKQDWNGNALAGATFILETEGTTVGTFTSDSDGLITIAFLSNNKDYTLSETRAPLTYHGIDMDMTISVNNGNVSVRGIDPDYFILTQAEGTTLASLTVKNRPFTFRAIKQDGNTNLPMQGVEFALHRQVTVDNVTTIDPNPIPGFERLVTDADGIIPQLDNTLSAGIYELREKATLTGYEMLNGYIRFTVSPTGVITLGEHPDDVALTETKADDGTLEYVLTILNTQRRKVRFLKVDASNINTILSGAVFDLYGVDTDGQTRLMPALYEGLTSGDDGLLADASGNTVFDLPIGVYHLVETQAPTGYVIKKDAVCVTVSVNDVVYNEGTNLSSSASGRIYDAVEKVYTLKVSNSSGFVLPETGGSGTESFKLLGSMLVLSAVAGFILLNKKKRAS